MISALDIAELAAPSMGLIAAGWFAAAILLVDRFDISLPRGDSMGVSGALVAAGLLSADPIPMAVLSVLVVPLASAGRAGSRGGRILDVMILRLASVALALAADLALLRLGGWSASLQLLVVPVVYLVSEVVIAQAIQSWRSARPLSRLLAGNFRRQIPLLGAQISTAILASITYPAMGPWSLLLVVALLMLTRQSLSSLLEMRETYRATVEVLVEAAEGQDPRRRGHAERSAQVARAISDRLGLSSILMERASYATLLHDLDALSPRSPDSTPEGFRRSSDVLEGSAFFADVLPILRLCDGCPIPGDLSETNATVAMIAALSSDIDMLANDMTIGPIGTSGVATVAPHVAPETKARVVAAAIELGYRIPAVV